MINRRTSSSPRKRRAIARIPAIESAKTRTTTQQNVYLVFLLLLVIVAIAVWRTEALTYFILASIVYYLTDFVFYMTVIIRGLMSKESSHIDLTRKNVDWPSYTILCPLYKESAVLPQFVQAMRDIDYPKKKLQILLLLEEDDVETVRHARRMKLPNYFEIIVVPHSLPKTKPKACNYGLSVATGEYSVIYDAEDIPDPKQLKMAATAYADSTEPIGCVQAKLNFYNSTQNYLTRLFTLEYSLWFEVVLPGLMTLNAPLPLGGTSNHFPTKLLCEIGAWDPYNVTEDADLGMRLAHQGFKTKVIDSTTMEEATSNAGSWIRQRSRWIKGYMQTYLVHTRLMDRFREHGGFKDVWFMHVILGIRSFGLLVNVLLWIVFIVNVTVKLLGLDGVQLPEGTGYLLLFNLLFVNTIYVYTYVLGIAKRNQWNLTPSLLTIPLYWFYMMLAAVKGAYELVVKPYYWQKTSHGAHLKPKGETES